MLKPLCYEKSITPMREMAAHIDYSKYTISGKKYYPEYWHLQRMLLSIKYWVEECGGKSNPR
jgi:hypothetical protein